MTLRTLGLLCLTLAMVGCSGDDSAPRPNVVLITMDTTRADHLSVYGYRFPTTPFLEEFAAEGARFNQVYAPAPATAPSHATLFTSLSPLTHRVLKNAVTLGEQHETLAELLSEAGYQTAAVLSSFVLNAKFGLGQGFQMYDDDLGRGQPNMDWHDWEGQEVEGAFARRGNVTTDRAVAWLETERDPDQPFFLFVHYFDPHDPYTPPRKYRGRFMDQSIESSRERAEISNYDGEIAFTDDEMRRLCAALDGLGLTEDTIVIITGDHGEGLWQRGYQYHGAHIYEEAVRVPLLMRWPGRIAAGSVFETPVTIADVVPTLGDFLGLPLEAGVVQGRSLVGCLGTGEPLDRELPVFLYRIPYEPQEEFGVWVEGEKHAIRYQSWKYLVGDDEGTTELYDLSADPGEVRNVIAEKPEMAARLARALDDWRQAVTLPDSLTVRPELSEEDVRKLRSLGYVD